jgi:hypothetical protein
MTEWLFSWGVTSVVAGFCASCALFFVGMSDYRLAKVFFLIAAADAIGGVLMWGHKSTLPHWAIALIVFAAVGGIAVLTLQAFWYSDRKQAKTTPDKAPDNRQDKVTLGDQKTTAVTPAPAIKTEVHRAPPKPPREIAQQPILAHIRIASQQTIASTNPALPYGLEVIVQTDQAIQPVAFVFECDGEIGEGRGGLISGGVYSLAGMGVIKDHPNWFVIKWSSPPFLPGTPIRLTLFSKTLIRVTELKQMDYTFP